MVYTAVQKTAVVGHQDEPLFSVEIGGHHRPRAGIQMVGGLVDEQKMALVQKQRRQQDLGLLSVGEGGKGPPEHM